MLDRLVVLDHSTGIAGPYCTKLLADAGAEVVEVPPEGGDPLAGQGSGGLYEFLHRSKRVASGPWSSLPEADVLVTDQDVDVTGLRRRHVGALAAVREARRSGEGEHVDVAMLDVMATTMVTYPSVFASFGGWPTGSGTGRVVEVPSIEPSSDGFVVFTTNSAQQFADFLVMIERPDLLEDEGLRRAAGGPHECRTGSSRTRGSRWTTTSGTSRSSCSTIPTAASRSWACWARQGSTTWWRGWASAAWPTSTWCARCGSSPRRCCPASVDADRRGEMLSDVRRRAGTLPAG